MVMAIACLLVCPRGGCAGDEGAQKASHPCCPKSNETAPVHAPGTGCLCTDRQSTEPAGTLLVVELPAAGEAPVMAAARPEPAAGFLSVPAMVADQGERFLEFGQLLI
jgi:hypothetical protein